MIPPFLHFQNHVTDNPFLIIGSCNRIGGKGVFRLEVWFMGQKVAYYTANGFSRHQY